MGFYFTGSEWGVSLYHANHRKDLDLSEIAVRWGGGGHRGACGFRAKSLPFWTAKDLS
jgi:nanoRNase/pAp phosphatase (c-di-AMP/oligoRNAs hydrolase)